MWRLDVSWEAELDIFEAALRYERERAHLGFRFEAQINALFARVLDEQTARVTDGKQHRRVRADARASHSTASIAKPGDSSVPSTAHLLTSSPIIVQLY